MYAPTNPLVGALLSDTYQLTMAYGYWKAGRQNKKSVFDLFFRKCPFGGEFAIFAGLDEILRMVETFHFTESDINYLQFGKIIDKERAQAAFSRGLQAGFIRQSPTNDGYEIYSLGRFYDDSWEPIDYPTEDVFVPPPMKDCDPEFFKWLLTVNTREVSIHAFPEGSVVFPREPLARFSGPLAVTQMLETPSLNLFNYPTLITTNAARFRLLAGDLIILIEMGLRRAQGPDGGISGAKYSYMGGFDSTSNMRAGQLFGIPIRGTHAHSFVSSFKDLTEIEMDEFAKRAIFFRDKIVKLFNLSGTNDGELAAFISYARSFPKSFLALVDTYDTLKSGVPNFLAVALTLAEAGEKPTGIRLDSGDLAYLSVEARAMFKRVEMTIAKLLTITLFESNKMNIAASNDINEAFLISLQAQEHELNTLGIGTNNITCEKQPALGGVYKLVEIDGEPRIKLSQNIVKVTFPGKKSTYRLFGNDGKAILDLIIRDGLDPVPRPSERVLCCDPFDQHKRVYVTPSEVRPCNVLCFENGKALDAVKRRTLNEMKAFAKSELQSLRPDHLRVVNPTPYKVSVSQGLFDYLHSLWTAEAPIEELR